MMFSSCAARSARSSRVDAARLDADRAGGRAIPRAGAWLAMVLCLFAAGCGEGGSGAKPAPSSTSSTQPAGSATGAPADGSGASTAAASPADLEGEFRFVSADEHNFLDPQKMSWLHDLRVAECLFETLVRVGVPSAQIEPGVASAWEVSDDRLTYTFHLRPDARWSNGDSVRASDFLFAWRRALMPDFAADYSQLLFRIEGAEAFFKWRQTELAAGVASGKATPWADIVAKFDATVAARAVDPQTLVVKLAQPTPYFLELCAFVTFGPNHAASLEPLLQPDPKSGMYRIDSGYWSDPKRLVGNGPYLLARRRFRQDLLMTQNPHYWDKASMGNRSILERIIENPQTALYAYDNGQAHWLPDIPTSSAIAADLLKQGRKDVIASPWAGTYFYNLNCRPTLADGRKNPLADARVRRALSMAIDRKALVEQVTRMNQPVAKTFIPPGCLPGYDAPVDAGVGFDPEGARKLLAEAGYRGGAGLKGLSILYNSGRGHENIAQPIKRSWEEHLGVVVTLEAQEGKSFSERLKKHSYTIARASWMGDYRDATTFLDKFRSENGNNDAAWKSPEYDALLDRAATEPDAPARLGILRQAEALMLADQPIAPLYHYVTLHVFDPAKVRGIEPNPWNFRRLERVRVEP